MVGHPKILTSHVAVDAVATAAVLSRQQPCAQQAKPMRIKHCYILAKPL